MGITWHPTARNAAAFSAGLHRGRWPRPSPHPLQAPHSVKAEAYGGRNAGSGPQRAVRADSASIPAGCDNMVLIWNVGTAGGAVPPGQPAPRPHLQRQLEPQWQPLLHRVQGQERALSSTPAGGPCEVVRPQRVRTTADWPCGFLCAPHRSVLPSPPQEREKAHQGACP